jgi:hypothetical protein
VSALRGTVLRVTLLACVAPFVRAQQPIAFDWNERWRYYLRRTYSFERVLLLAGDTGVEHVIQPSDCGRNPHCYPASYARAFTRRVARTSVEFAVGGFLGEDARRRPSQMTGLKSRVLYAITHAYVATGPDGRIRPAYSRFAGTFASAAAGSGCSRNGFSSRDWLGGFGGSVGLYVQDSLLAEFEPDLKRVGLRLGRKLGRPFFGDRFRQ